jgi:predicted transcriptional regulator
VFPPWLRKSPYSVLYYLQNIKISEIKDIVEEVIVMCRNIGLIDIEIYGSYLNRKEII